MAGRACRTFVSHSYESRGDPVKVWTVWGCAMMLWQCLCGRTVYYSLLANVAQIYTYRPDIVMVTTVTLKIRDIYWEECLLTLASYLMVHGIWPC